MEFLKELFKEALTYDQFVEAVNKKGYKLADLSKGDYVAKDKFTTANNKVTELEGKLENANTEIQGFKDLDIEGIKTKATEWETKYNTEKAAWEQEKNDRTYLDAVNSQLEGVKFTSNLAKEAIVGKIKEKNLNMQDGKLLGFDDFLKGLKEQDGGAFVPDDTVKVDFGGNLNDGKGIDTDKFFSAFKNAAGVNESK